MTRGGVEYNLNVSPFYKTVNGVTYFFSSRTYLNKFSKKLMSHRCLINKKFEKIGFDVGFTTLCDINLYLSIEKRGFLVKYQGREYQCKNEILFAGEVLMKKN